MMKLLVFSKSPFFKIRKEIYFFSLFGLLLGWGIFNHYLSKDLSLSLPIEISKEEKLALEPLLKDLVFQNDFGYALVDAKPVSIASYFSLEPFINLLLYKKHCKFNLRQSLQVLQKYQKKLSSNNFLLLINNSYFPKINNLELENNPRHLIELINKRLFIETVEAHLPLFKQVLGKNIIPSCLLDQLIQENKSLFEFLNYDEELYGILLGYGRENTRAFKRNMALIPLFEFYYKDWPAPVSLSPITPSSSFSSLEEEYAYLQKELTFFDLNFPLSPFSPPAFRAFQEKRETQLLKEKYRHAHRQLLKMYSEKDFLNVTLDQF